MQDFGISDVVDKIELGGNCRATACTDMGSFWERTVSPSSTRIDRFYHPKLHRTIHSPNVLNNCNTPRSFRSHHARRPLAVEEFTVCIQEIIARKMMLASNSSYDGRVEKREDY